MTDNAKDRVKSGQSMASLQIALGIWGLLLLAVTAIVSSRSPGTMAAALVLLAGTVLAASGGIAGLKPERERSASQLMIAGGALLTVCALVLLIVALKRGDVNWYFPLGAMFLTLAALSDVASCRFRRAAMTPGSPRTNEDSR
jgi:peptidoglycan/LPS O-acetylase OafA/YrhL